MSQEKQDQKRGVDTGEGPEEGQLPQGRNYLFIVGIDHYNDKAIPRLQNAVKDAKKVLEILVDKYQFDKENLFTLYDGEATQSAIIGRLKSLAKTAKEDDTLLMYFAGHGEYDEIIDVGYWIPVDARHGEIGSYISFDLVTRLVRAIKTRHTFIITDSCYSGSFFTTRRATTAEDRLESLPSRWLLTAGRKEVVSDGWEGEHSPFARAVLWHLDNNREPRLRVSQFCNEVVVAVGNNADQLPRGAALQNVGDMGGEFMFRLKEYKDTVFERPAEEPAATGSQGKGREAGPSTTATPAPEKKPAPLRTLGDVRERLKDYIRESEFEKAFELFNRIIDDRSGRENDVIMQQSQYSSITKQMRNNLVDPSFANITLNRIRFALNSIVDDLEE
ncbi:MAG: caspase family protein, partial [Phaeodactylibacter sp.]|nr:caspase family protein [Phaeodactylibacter sp.]